MRLAVLALVVACGSTAPAPREPPSNEVRPAPIDAAPVVAPIEGHVLSSDLMGPEQIFTVDKGTADGVNHHGTAKVVVDDSKVFEAVIIRVDKHSTVIKLDALRVFDLKSVVVQFVMGPPEPELGPDEI